MPREPEPLRRAQAAAEADQLGTTARGYGTVHQNRRKALGRARFQANAERYGKAAA